MKTERKITDNFIGVNKILILQNINSITIIKLTSYFSVLRDNWSNSSSYHIQWF